MKELTPGPIARTQTAKAGIPSWMRGLIALFALFLFISAVKMIGGGLKIVAKDDAGQDFLRWIFSMVEDPMTALLIGVLVTSLVQSSSFTTSFVVGLVAMPEGSGISISLHSAVPIIMGANIGTSVTNILVSLAHVRHREEFRLSLGGAIVHDFFLMPSCNGQIPPMIPVF